jgi:hypothetical protein
MGVLARTARLRRVDLCNSQQDVFVIGTRGITPKRDRKRSHERIELLRNGLFLGHGGESAD